MIFLIKNTVNGEVIYLLEHKEYKVGRKNCDILLENDQSISREHAKFRINSDHVTLEDCKSKYHTLHKGVEIEPNVEIRLKHMDTIQFGIYNNQFCFESYEFLVAASVLSPDKKATLKQSLIKCNGKYVDKWSSTCTHLTVDKLTLTTKVLQALVDEKPIVTLDYWIDYVKAIERKTSLPDVDNYRPVVSEQLLRSDFEYKIDPQRRKLFDNKVFVFLKASTEKQLHDVIKSCGGSSISWDVEQKTLLDINRSPREYLFVTTENDEQNASFGAVIKDLGKSEKRPIPINEIALAIIHCSCDINCNSNFNKVSEVFGGALRTPKHQARDVLVTETQSENIMPCASEIKTEKIIPASIEDDWMVAVEMKDQIRNQGERNENKRSSEEQAEFSAPKRLKLGIGKDKKNNQAKSTKLGTGTSFIEKQNDAGSSVESDLSKNKSQSSQKRKAVEEPNGIDSLELNPFRSIKPSLSKKNKRSEESNPFELTRSTKSTKPSPLKTNQNPFANIMNVGNRAAVKIENVLPREDQPKEEIQLVSFKSASSAVSFTKKSIFNITWTSKSSIKQEVLKEEDPELAKISEAFRDSVRVEVMPMYDRPINKMSNTSLDNVDGKKNFKIFRKVKPLKPQSTVISRHMFKKIAPGDLTGIIVNDKDSEDEEGPHESRIKQIAKPMGKRFVL